MLNEDRLKIMTKLAIFESENKNDIKISGYFKHDYIGINLIFNLIWMSIGYACAVGVYLFLRFESGMEDLNLDWIKKAAIVIIGIYLILIILYAVAGHIIYSKKHRESRYSMREYYANLRRLEKLYRLEEEEQRQKFSENERPYRSGRDQSRGGRRR